MVMYSLQADEAVIMKEDNLNGAVSELILTNLYLVWIEYAALGFKKKIMQFPLSQIKMFDGRVKAVFGKNSDDTTALEVYFLNSPSKKFAFEGGERKTKIKVASWIKAINKAATGNDISQIVDFELAELLGKKFGNSESIVESFKDTVDIFTGAMGLGTNIFGGNPKNNESSSIEISSSNVPSSPVKSHQGSKEKVVGKCSACGAPVSGLSGKIVKCSYCDTEQKL